MKPGALFLSFAALAGLVGLVRLLAFETPTAVAAIEPDPIVQPSSAQISPLYVSPTAWADAHGSAFAQDPPTTTVPELSAVDAGAIFLRAAPDRNADILRIIPARKRIAVLDEKSLDWLRAIDLETGAFGWVSANYFNPPEPPTVKPVATKRRAKKAETPIAAPEPVDAKPTENVRQDDWACPCK